MGRKKKEVEASKGLRASFERFERRNPVFKVAARRCAECLFTPNRIVSEDRMSQILAGCARKDRHFVCHKASNRGDDVCCRGFYETRLTTRMVFLKAMGRVRFFDSETGEAVDAEEGERQSSCPTDEGQTFKFQETLRK